MWYKFIMRKKTDEKILMVFFRIIFMFGWLNCLYFGFYFFKEKQSFDEFLKFLRVFYFDWMPLGFFGGLVQGLLSLLILFIMAFSIMAFLYMIKEWITKGEVKIFKDLE